MKFIHSLAYKDGTELVATCVGNQGKLGAYDRKGVLLVEVITDSHDAVTSLMANISERTKYSLEEVK